MSALRGDLATSELKVRDQLDTDNQTYPSKVGILIWVGLWCMVLALMAYVNIALQEIPAADVVYVPDEPPQMLPEFLPPTKTPDLPDEQQSPTPQPSYEPEERLPARRAAPDREPATSPPTRIVARSIGMDSPVVPVGWRVEESEQGPRVVWEVASYAAGWHRDSSYPGNGGNVVLSGHNNTAGEVFRYLMDLDAGAEIDLYVDDKVYPYTVEKKMLLEEAGMAAEVRRQNAQWIAPTNDERLTLVTCWPYSTYTHRLIVTALPMR